MNDYPAPRESVAGTFASIDAHLTALQDRAYLRFREQALSFTHGEPRWICRQCKTHFLVPLRDCEWCPEFGTVQERRL